MNRNVEWKARAVDPERQRQIAERCADGPVEIIDQIDTFFRVSEGRLKLRQTGEHRGELIHYHRDDQSVARLSQYVLIPTEHPEMLREVLASVLGIRGEVRKRRHVYLAGQTRIHVDEVEGLGTFLEVEVVLQPGQSIDEGKAIADSYQDELDVGNEDLIRAAYIDLCGCSMLPG